MFDCPIFGTDSAEFYKDRNFEFLFGVFAANLKSRKV